ncbi:OmpA family protein [Pararoseomonas indoligenes]|uniref:OmpA family protein n=1 Tax=Roseomonas indoligenes TaxID=2820811 RepID=A0A940MWD8_9PROT|nr:OmpA family protein [Pararoseomonas indoligenes]MBP0492908.1 OmpA family protein [Pararoseomonas indoligenes]
MRRTLLSLGLSLALLAACAAEDNLGQHPSWVVFFTEDGAGMDPAARAVVSEAASLANRNPAAPVLVAGFADPDATRAYNRALSEIRAQNVAAALGEDGVAPACITVALRGGVPFIAFPVESRRVEIKVGP